MNKSRKVTVSGKNLSNYSVTFISLESPDFYPLDPRANSQLSLDRSTSLDLGAEWRWIRACRSLVYITSDALPRIRGYELASSPTSDLATMAMSAMFYAIYTGSQSVSEYHTRCASWCSTSSMEQRRHTWLAWSRASPILGRWHLRSAAEGLFDLPRTRTVFGFRAFSIAGPLACNGLLTMFEPSLRYPISALKTLFFQLLAYADSLIQLFSNFGDYFCLM